MVHSRSLQATRDAAGCPIVADCNERAVRKVLDLLNSLPRAPHLLNTGVPMRPRLLGLICSIPLLATLMGSGEALAAEPRNPFEAAPAVSPTSQALPDPFASTNTPTGEPSSRLKDPFAVHAPDCPKRTTDEGVVIQRPSRANCKREPTASRIHDPWPR